MEFKYLISIVTVVVIFVSKMSKPDKLPFSVTEQQFPLGVPNIAAIACSNKRILKSTALFLFYSAKSLNTG